MSSTLLLKKSNYLIDLDIKLCIICQKSSSSTVVSTENGRKKIIEAASIREDKVLWRLRSLAIDQHFCYHMDNQCYKKYCLKKTVGKIKVKEKIISFA